MVTIKSFDKKEFDGYLAQPAGGYGPGIVVIQEIFGVNSHIKAVTDFAVSYTSGKVPDLAAGLKEVDKNIDDQIAKSGK